MSVPTNPATAHDPRDGSLITINIDIDTITIGTLRWLIAIADATGLDDSERVFPSYDEQWDQVVNGLEIYVRGNDLPKLGGTK